VLNKKFNN